MTNEQTLAETMDVLRAMFPNVTVPEPRAFAYPRWGTTPWSYGSFSCWPAGTTLEMHENLRANVDRLWFAGEHTSATYFGYMQGAWFEGRDAGERIAELIKGVCTGAGVAGGVTNDTAICGERARYEVLHGTTEADEYSAVNGWEGTSFQTKGLSQK